MGAPLVKTRSVLHFSGLDPRGNAVFEREKDEPDEGDRSIVFDYATLLDLGEPEVVTVTIEPGDRLNED